VSKKILLGVLLIMSIIAIAVPVSAQPRIINVTVTPSIYNPCIKTTMTVEFNINSTLPEDGIIRIGFLYGTFNITSVTDVKVYYNTGAGYTPANDYTWGITVSPPDNYVWIQRDGTGLRLNTGNMVKVIIYNITTPCTEGTYNVYVGTWGGGGATQWDSGVAQVQIKAIVVPEKPWIEPCEEYGYDEEKGVVKRFYPDACFKICIPYMEHEGLRFEGAEVLVYDPVNDVWKDLQWHNQSDFDLCNKTECTPVGWMHVFDFANSSGGFTANGSWEWGEPIDLIDHCDRSYNNAWGLNLEGNYTANEVSYLMSPTIFLNDGNKYTGTVYLSFDYSSFLDPNATVDVQYWNATTNSWVTILTIKGNSSWDNQCLNDSGVLSFNVANQEATQIRFWFNNTDANTDIGFYLHYLAVWVDQNCTETPVYYCLNNTAFGIPCGCCEQGGCYCDDCVCKKVCLEPNSVTTFKVKAIYYDVNYNEYKKSFSDPLTYIIDTNQGPEITLDGSDDNYVYVNVNDSLSGVATTGDIYIANGFETPHNSPGFDGDWTYEDYYYHVVPPDESYKSACIHFDRIEMAPTSYIIIFYDERCYIPIYEIIKDWWLENYTNYMCDHLILHYESLHEGWFTLPLSKDQLSECCGHCLIDNKGALVHYHHGLYSVEYGFHVDMVIFGTGLKVFLDGNDITSECVIEYVDDNNVTIKVPKSLLGESEHELMVVATDNVGNANYAKFKVSAEGGGQQPTPPTNIEQTIHKYYPGADVSNKNDVLQAIINAINEYFTAPSDEKPEILSDIIAMIDYYFTL